MGFRVIRNIRNAFHRTDFHTLWRIEVSDALGTFHGVDFVILDALVNCLVWTLRFANIAIDAFLGDLERQNLPQFVETAQHRLLHFFTHKLGHVSVQPGDLFNQCG